MRLIYVDELVKKWEAMLPIMVPDEDGKHPVSLEKVIEKLKDAPTVDAVPVVRCEKCTHHKGLNAMEKFEYGSNVVWCNIPHFGGVLMKNDAFCSYGERKDGE